DVGSRARLFEDSFLRVVMRTTKPKPPAPERSRRLRPPEYFDRGLMSRPCSARGVRPGIPQEFNPGYEATAGQVAVAGLAPSRQIASTTARTAGPRNKPSSPNVSNP